MELNDIQLMIAVIVGIGATIEFLRRFLKYLHDRYIDGLNTRIDGCITKKVLSITNTQIQHGERIKSLEDRFNDFWRYLRRGGPSNES